MLLEEHLRVDGTVYGRVGLDPNQKPLYTQDEIRPTMGDVPSGVGGEERDKLITEGRLKQAIFDYRFFDLENLTLDPSKRLGSGEHAFIIHMRSLDDVALAFPWLSRKYMTEEEILTRCQKIPPFRASRVTGLRNKDGCELPGWVVAANLLPEHMEKIAGLRDAGRPREALALIQEAKKSIYRSAKLAYQLGADIVSLGGMSGTLTGLGTDLEIEFPELNVTTGHALTCYTLNQTRLAATRELGIDSKETTVAIVGAAGSIGAALAEMCVSQVKKLLLFDKLSKKGKLESFAEGKKLRGAEVTMGIYGVVNNQDEQYQKLREADVIITATTQDRPFIRPEWLEAAVLIDDAAPHNVSKGVAEVSGGVSLDVLVSMPQGFSWNFDFGLVHGSSYACGAEGASLAAQGLYDRGHTGPVTNGTIDRIAQLASRTGFGLAPFQSFGELKTREDFARLRERMILKRNRL